MTFVLRAHPALVIGAADRREVDWSHTETSEPRDRVCGSFHERRQDDKGLVCGRGGSRIRGKVADRRCRGRA
eukprot:579910-Rhodomonas_salina.2